MVLLLIIPLILFQYSQMRQMEAQRGGRS
jgi:putrescine transport system permease protein